MKRETRIWLAVFLLAGAYLAWRAATIGNGRQYVRKVDDRWAVATVADRVAGTAVLSPSRTIGTWIAAFLTLTIFSFLYRDNPFYKTSEAIVIGVSAAYWMVVAFWDVLIPNLFAKIWPAWIQSWAMPGLAPEREQLWYANLIPLALGIMLLWRLAPKGHWIALWPLAFTIGAFAGLRLVAYFQADFLNQIRNSILPLADYSEGKGWKLQTSIENVLLLIGIVACLVYFFFSVEHKGTIGKISKLGIWYLMITFGAGFGFTVMGRIALLAVRLEFLFDDWLWLIDPTNKRLGM
jgi:hypothetical protein